LAPFTLGDGPVAALCAAQCIVGEDGRVHPNPLWRLVAPGDTITEHDGAITIRPAQATIESITLAPDRNDAVVTVDPATTDPLVLRFRTVEGSDPSTWRSHEHSVKGSDPSMRAGRRFARSVAAPHAVWELAGGAARAAFAANALGDERPPVVVDPLQGIK